jgi:alpha-L-rhamnosidase
MKAIRLRTEHIENPVGIDAPSPCLSWNCEGGNFQSAYEITAVSGGREIWNSGRIQSGKMLAHFDSRLDSRMRVEWAVRLWDENGNTGGWSERAFFETGLLSIRDWTAKWINPELRIESEKQQPASYLKKEFAIDLDSADNARLYITCHGLYAAYINGQRAGDFVLAPGTGNYPKRLQYQAYNVSGLLTPGKNEILVVLGDGWYRGCLGIDSDRNIFGKDIALLCQLEIDGKAVFVSDESWLASQNGPVRENDLEQGEWYDARLENITDWHKVSVAGFGFGNLVCSKSAPIREQERFTGRVFKTPNGETVVDFGQNIAGYVSFTVTARAGEKLTLVHGETLDADGNFTNTNFQPGKRNKTGGIKQRIDYICKDGINRYKPRFCIFGFQYVKVVTDINLDGAEFIAHAVYSDMEQAGFFECSDENINKLVQNSLWSQKSNFCDIPTDCPTRERAGWTGDAGAFVSTGLILADCYPVYRKWLAELRLGQKPDGRVSNIVPPNGKSSFYIDILSASVGWGDACIIVPYTLYRMYGDITILRENYDMMTRWLSFLQKRAKKSRFKNRFRKNPYRRYTVDTGADWGEWNEPGLNMADTLRDNILKGNPETATAYLSYSSRLMSEIAAILDKPNDSEHYAHIAEMARKAFNYVCTENGRIVSDRQCRYVRALAFNLLDEDKRAQTASDLDALVKKNNYHLNTGFLSTPFLCGVLADNGYVETAYKLLLQDTPPSWLYAVKQGANTIWETWDGKKPDGTVKDSLNHYSYGAVTGWLFEGVCGIRVENGAVTISPKPCELLRYAKAVFNSPIGKIESGWRYENGKFRFDFGIPANVKVTAILPGGSRHQLTPGHHSYEQLE